MCVCWLPSNYIMIISTSIELGNVAKRCARCVLVQLFRPFFATGDFEHDKDQVTRPNWIRRDRCVTSCDNCTVMWQVVTSEWSFEETHTNAPRRPPTQEWRWFVFLTRDSIIQQPPSPVIATLSLISCPLASGYKLRQTRGNASKDYDYDNIYVLPKKLMFLVPMTT